MASTTVYAQLRMRRLWLLRLASRTGSRRLLTWAVALVRAEYRFGTSGRWHSLGQLAVTWDEP